MKSTHEKLVEWLFKNGPKIDAYFLSMYEFFSGQDSYLTCMNLDSEGYIWVGIRDDGYPISKYCDLQEFLVYTNKLFKNDQDILVYICEKINLLPRRFELFP